MADARPIAVIGAGTMGHGIAQVFAMAGYEVRLTDTSGDIVRAGMDRIAKNLDGGVVRGKVTNELRDASLARISAAPDLELAAAGVQAAIEAVPERMDLKLEVLGALERAAPDDALLGSNTSGLSISALQRDARLPERILGLHFFNPVHINPLVEVVRGQRTSDATVSRALDLVDAIGKQSVVITDSPGFATSRLGVLLGLEAIRMVEEGVARPEDIDRALELGYRHPMGPLRLTDLVGLDVRLDIAKYLHERLGGDRFRPPALLERMVAEGRLGKKTGRGFFDWTGGGEG